jgi:hypothetical protein
MRCFNFSIAFRFCRSPLIKSRGTLVSKTYFDFCSSISSRFSSSADSLRRSDSISALRFIVYFLACISVNPSRLPSIFPALHFRLTQSASHRGIRWPVYLLHQAGGVFERDDDAVVVGDVVGGKGVAGDAFLAAPVVKPLAADLAVIST